MSSGHRALADISSTIQESKTLLRTELLLVCLELVLTFITCATQMLWVNLRICFISNMQYVEDYLFPK